MNRQSLFIVVVLLASAFAGGNRQSYDKKYDQRDYGDRGDRGDNHGDNHGDNDDNDDHNDCDGHYPAPYSSSSSKPTPPATSPTTSATSPTPSATSPTPSATSPTPATSATSPTPATSATSSTSSTSSTNPRAPPEMQQNCGGPGKHCMGGSCVNCAGGSCLTGQCIKKTTLTKAEVDIARGVCRAFFQEPTPNAGDTQAAYVRGMFHDFGPFKRNQGCLLVPCNGIDECERTRDQNRGLEEVVVGTIDRYWREGISHLMNMADFWVLCGTEAVADTSNGEMSIPFRWNRDECDGLQSDPPTSHPRGTDLPHPLQNSTDILQMMQDMGFDQQEFFCLIGAHGIGGAEPKNTGFARSWSHARNRLDNNFYVTLVDRALLWDVEVAEVATDANGNQLPNVPFPPNNQYHIRGLASHTDLMMLHSDMDMWWVVDNSGCSVIHMNGENSCPPRLTGAVPNAKFSVTNDGGPFSHLNFFANNPDVWRNCFTSAFKKMIEMNHSNLRDVSP